MSTHTGTVSLLNTAYRAVLLSRYGAADNDDEQQGFDDLACTR
jgi:hypothetical protein